MRIRMLTTAQGPGGTWMSGREYELGEDLAADFVLGGYAIEVATVTPGAPATAEEPAAEVSEAPEPAGKKLKDMNKAELQAVATSLELETDGTNAELVLRIEAKQAGAAAQQ